MNGHHAKVMVSVSKESSVLKIFREKPFLLLIFITILYFYRPIFLGEVFYFRDLHSHFLPKRQLVAEYISRFDLPLWDPYLQGGKPLLANPNNMTFYPSNLLYLWIPAHRALTLEIILHLLTGALGVYVFSRLLSFQPTCSFIAAIIYGFCGYTLSTINLLNWFIASAYLPVLFCLWHLYLTQHKRKWWAFSILAASLQLLAGAPELTLFTFMGLFLWSICYPYSDSISRRIVHWIVFCVITAGICLMQILPAIEFSRSSIRSVGFGFDSSTAWSLHPYRILEFIFPGILGRYDSLVSGSFWGQKLDGPLPFFLSVYFGMTALTLCFIGGFSRTEQQSFPKSVRKLFIVMIFISVILATGRYLPGLSQFYEFFSLRVPFRFPEKWIAAAVFPVAMLAAFGSEVLFSDRTNEKRLRLFFWTVSGALMVLIVLFTLPHFVEVLTWSIFGRGPNEQMKNGLRTALLHSFFIWTLVCLLFQTKFGWRHRGVAAVLLLDLLISGLPLMIFGPSELYTKTPPLAVLIKKQIDDEKLYRAPNVSNYVLSTPDDDFFWNIQWHQEVLSTYLASKYKIPVIFHDDLDASSLIELNYMRLVLDSLPWGKKLPLLSAAGVKMILTPETLSLPGVNPVAKIQNASNVPLYLFSNDHALPSVSFASNWRSAKNTLETLQMMTVNGYDPGTVAMIQAPSIAPNNICSGSRILENHSGMRSRSCVIDNRCDGYIVFAEPNYPGWHVDIDGIEKPIVKANVIYFAAFLGKGTHSVRAVYFPGSVLWGAALSALSFLIVVTCFFLKKDA